MAAFSVANSNILFRKYNKDVFATVNMEALSHNMAQTETWEGDLISRRIEVALPTSVGNANGEGAAYPVADYPRFVEMQIGRRYYHGSGELTLGLLAAAKGGPNSVRSAADAVVRSLTKAAIKDHNIQFFLKGDGILASLAAATVASSTTSLTLTGRYNATSRTHTHPIAGIWPNATYEIRDENNNYAVLGESVITRITPLSTPGANATAVVPTVSYTAAVGDVLVKKGTYGVCFSGLHKLIDNDVSGTFQGVTMSGATNYTSTVLGASNSLRALTPTLLKQLLQGVIEKSGKELTGRQKLLGHPAQWANFSDMYAPELRVSSSDSVVGNKAKIFQSPLGDVELAMDTDAPPTDLFLIDPSQLRWAEQRPLGFVLDKGEVWTPSRTAAVMNCNLYEVGEMYVLDRRTMGKITDLNYSLVSGF